MNYNFELIEKFQKLGGQTFEEENLGRRDYPYKLNFQQEVLKQFRSNENINYLRTLFIDYMDSSEEKNTDNEKILQFLLSNIEDSIFKFNMGNVTDYYNYTNDYSFWDKVRQLNLTYFNQRIQFVKDNK